MDTEEYMKLIDLSHVIDNNMPVYPGDSPACMTQDKFLHSDGFNHHRLAIGMHTGTHIDAPMHQTEGGKYINEYGLDIFCGTAKVLDVTGEPVITFRDSFDGRIQKNDIVLFYTGHDEKYGTDGYFTDHPALDMNMVEFLVEKNVRLIGLDMPSPDHDPFPVHRKLLENDILIIENLRNLKELRNMAIRLYAFPLNIRADASIVRVVAEIIPDPAG